MQLFVERNLNSIHEKSIDNQLWTKFLKIMFGIFLLCLIPYLHVGVFGYLVWPAKPPVDETSCSCSCFDTVFRGSYEAQSMTNYKHWYFNATLNAYKMWCLIIVGLITAYECFKHLLTCVIEKDVRYTMVFLFASTVFPHYYSWWNYLNYYNERFYEQWYHQLYFTISEIIASAVTLYLIRRSKKLQTFHILTIFSINLSHIIIGGVDQFIENIIYSYGSKHQVVRDFGLVLPDFLALIMVGYETKCLLKARRIQLKELFYKEELLFFVFITTSMVLIGKNL